MKFGIDRLLEEPGLRERLSQGAVRRAKLEFDDGVMARRSLDLYAKLRAAQSPAEHTRKRR